MERRENDKLLPEHAKDASYPEDWWLDEADSADGLPVFAMDEAEDFVKDRQRLKGVPMVYWYFLSCNAIRTEYALHPVLKTGFLLRIKVFCPLQSV